MAKGSLIRLLAWPAWVLAGLAAGGLLALAGRPAEAGWVWTAAALPVAALVAWQVFSALRGGRLGVDVVALAAIVSALLLGEPLAAAVVALMVAGGGALDAFAEARAQRELTALLARAPREARRVRDGTVETIPVAAIAPGDVLLVGRGEIFAADGALLDGRAAIDLSAMTGEVEPQPRREGETIPSGAVNASEPVRIEARSTSEASTYAGIVRLVRRAQQDRPPMVRMADRVAVAFVPFTALVAGLAWWLAGDPARALAVLVVATPCPLILAAPVALSAGVAHAARRGIVVKGGAVLERLARVATIVFDKTGTLTAGDARVAGVFADAPFERAEVLRLAAALEHGSRHPAARAILAAAAAEGLAPPVAEALRDHPGEGLTGSVEGHRVAAGGTALMRTLGLEPPERGVLALASLSGSVAWVAVDGRIVGAIALADRLRPETASALRSLRAIGIARLVMLTGDRAAAASETAAALGLDAVLAERDPAAKVAAVRAESARSPTAMVGDGVNDAPALAVASVGIAMGAAGAAAAAEAADAVILVDRFDRVAEAVLIARRARAIAWQSVLVGMGLSALAMLVAAAGHIPPVAGALLQEAIDVAVILNALRALSGAITPPIAIAPPATLAAIADDHAGFRALAAECARAARTLDAAALHALAARLAAEIPPHQAREEAEIYPRAAQALGGRDPVGALLRMHADLIGMVRRLSVLTGALDGKAPDAAEAAELRRLLYGLEAVLTLHIAAEEEMFALFSDAAPARAT
jgi:heavy metal translocating P-type ATPase